MRSVPKKLIFPTRNEQEVEADLELLDIDGNFFLLQLVMLLLGLQVCFLIFEHVVDTTECQAEEYDVGDQDEGDKHLEVEKMPGFEIGRVVLMFSGSSLSPDEALVYSHVRKTVQLIVR